MGEVVKRGVNVRGSLEKAASSGAGGFWRREEVKSGGDDLAASLEEIEKLDAALKIKATEEKKARLSRIQTEEEWRDVLNALPCFRVPEGVKINAEQFMKLLNEAVETGPDCSTGFKANDLDGNLGDGLGNKEEEKEGKANGRQQNTNNLAFVRRNIRLAKCGRGTLSLTDEEKLRIENLLMDIEDSESKGMAKGSLENQLKEPLPESKEEFYAIDHETKSILGEIDQRLEVLAKLKTPKGLRRGTYPSEEGNMEMTSSKESGKQGRNRGRRKERKGSRLEEINKRLNSMNSASEEEVSPLPKEEIDNLVEELRRSLIEEKGGGRKEEEDAGGEVPLAQLPQHVITELVATAKLLMPKFKYRFDESSETVESSLAPH